MADWGDPPLLGGHLALDFANTLDGRGTARERERLTDYGALVAWARAAGAVDRRAAEDLRAYADWAPGSAAEVLAEARALREAIYRVAAAISAGPEGTAPEAADLEALNDSLAPLLGATRLHLTADGPRPAWGGAPDAPERVLWPVARAAFELLSGAAAGRLRACADADCRRLFLDRSKNGSRRWCAMADCGNLAKARRHRARTQGLARDLARDSVKSGDHAT